MAVIEAIATTYLEANATSVTFSSLGSYKHLQLRISAKSTRSTTYTNDDIKLNFNGDTGSNYAYHRITGEDTTADADATSSGSYLKVSSVQSDGGLSGAANYGGLIVDILDYADDGNKNSTVMGTSGLTEAPIGKNRVTFFMGMWNNTDDVTSIALAPANGDFIRGSEITLYGIND